MMAMFTLMTTKMLTLIMTLIILIMHVRVMIIKLKRHNDCLFIGCLTSQQHVSASQGRIYSDNCTC